MAIFPHMKSLTVTEVLSYKHYTSTSAITAMFPSLQRLSVYDHEFPQDHNEWAEMEEFEHRNINDTGTSDEDRWSHLDYVKSEYALLYALGLMISIGTLVLTGKRGSSDFILSEIFSRCRPQALKICIPFATYTYNTFRAHLLGLPQLERLYHEPLYLWNLDNPTPDDFIAMHQGTSLVLIRVKIVDHLNINSHALRPIFCEKQLEFAQKLADACPSLRHYSVICDGKESSFQIISTPNGRLASPILECPERFGDLEEV
ncbi:hypothetical protein K474DRAFT_1669910 [Panus rudis PR-1116 ss-1]|nr:hypothetical protein K474DRAFT_1669910 [Panus rudis PR-1116 ss-1]